MGFLRINREGEVRIAKFSRNQCKGHGHRKYKYEVKIEVCDSNLDNHKFVVDHVKIHEGVQHVFTTKSSSCEILCMAIAKELKKRLEGVHVINLYIKLRPVLTAAVIKAGNLAYMEYSDNGKFSD